MIVNKYQLGLIIFEREWPKYSDELRQKIARKFAMMSDQDIMVACGHFVKWLAAGRFII